MPTPEELRTLRMRWDDDELALVALLIACKILATSHQSAEAWYEELLNRAALMGEARFQKAKAARIANPLVDTITSEYARAMLSAPDPMAAFMQRPPDPNLPPEQSS